MKKFKKKIFLQKISGRQKSGKIFYKKIREKKSGARKISGTNDSRKKIFLQPAAKDQQDPAGKNSGKKNFPGGNLQRSYGFVSSPCTHARFVQRAQPPFVSVRTL